MPEILRLPPKDVINAVKQKTAEIHTGQSELAYAELVFGHDFIGPRALRIINEELRTRGCNFSFIVPDSIFPYAMSTVRDLAEDVDRGRDRFIILRPSHIVRNHSKIPITVPTLMRLFSTKPFERDRIFFHPAILLKRKFGLEKHKLKPGWAAPTLGIIPEDAENWGELGRHLYDTETRRTVTEAVLDLVLYYMATKTKLLPDEFDWVHTATAPGLHFAVGQFDNDGITIAPALLKGTNVGMCTQR